MPFAGNWLRKWEPGHSYQQIMNRGAGDLRQFGLGTMVLLQFKGSILPSSMAPSGEDLVRLPDLISMGRHGH